MYFDAFEFVSLMGLCSRKTFVLNWPYFGRAFGIRMPFDRGTVKVSHILNGDEAPFPGFRYRFSILACFDVPAWFGIRSFGLRTYGETLWITYQGWFE